MKNIKYFATAGFIILIALSLFIVNNFTGHALATDNQREWYVSLEAQKDPPANIYNVGFGVAPWATDNYDVTDAGKALPPPGFSPFVWAWFNRPTWGQGGIILDLRS